MTEALSRQQPNPFREEIAETLKKYDEHTPSQLAEIFQKACEVQDTNQFVRYELEQVSTLFHKLYTEYYEGDRERKKIIKDIQEEMKTLTGPLEQEQFRNKLNELKTYQAACKGDLDQIHQAASTVGKLAHEHRQSKLAEASYIHFTQIQVLYSVLQAIIIQNVVDPLVRMEIGRQIDMAMKKVFGGVKSVGKEG